MRRSTFAVITVAAALAGAPAQALAAPRAHAALRSDPWEGFNRRAFAFNQDLDRAVLRPIIRLFHLHPGPIGAALHNFLTNLTEPVVFLNDVLQGHPKHAAGTVARFAINTSVGVGGILDVAKRAGIAHHDNGFGVTLGRYGVGPGPYLFLPLFGPSTVRDLLGTGVDTVSDPLFWGSYPYKRDVGFGVAVFRGLDQRIQAGPELDALISDAADPYATLRSTWLQEKQGEIDEARGVTAALPDIEGAEPPSSAPSSAPAPPPDEAPAVAPAAETPSPPPAAPPPSDPPGPAASVDLPGEIVLSANRADQRSTL